MGIYDREYYRREGPSFLGSLANTGQVCKWLIITNVIIWVCQLLSRPAHGGQDWFVDAFALDPNLVMHGQVWRLLTYAFLHAGLWHILFNMLFLWWFGSDMEVIYGPREFLSFYLVSAILGGLAFQLAWAVDLIPGVLPRGFENLPGDDSVARPIAPICLGASGAVTAVMLLYACHFPHRVIYIWFVLPVPIWLFVGFQVLQDSVIFMSQSNTQTAVSVHLGGAAFAFLYYKSQIRLLSLLPDVRAWQRQRARPQLRVYREEEDTPTPRPGASLGGDVDEQLEAKLDAVLEKVARTGQGSLTEPERQILLRASEIYKRRRT
jgi:membrane associated rhomboid family serine protease